MNKTSLVLTVIGSDRPGLVESIAKLVAEHGGNWLESRMAHLAGQFAGILRVEVDAEQAGQLADALGRLTASGLDSVVRSDMAAAGMDQRPLLQLDLVGQDRPGIVREISSVLASLGVNVEELNTERLSAPTTGQALFHATAELRLPSGLEQERLREALEAVAHDLMVDVALAPTRS
jgi:glycine cleavage system regulatory protein